MRGNDLAVIIGRNTAHHVVRGRHHRNRRLGRIDVGELDRDIAYARQTMAYDFITQVIKLEQNVIAVRTATATFLDLGGHRPRYHVAAGQIFRGRRITRHETFAILVHQVSAFAAHAFGDQHTCSVHAGRMELEELHVFQRNPCACRHPETVAGIDVGIGTRREYPPRAARCEQRGACLQNHHFAGFDFHRHHAQHVAILVANQIQRHPLDEEIRICTHVLLIQRVQQGMSGAVSRGAGARHRILAVILHVSAERTLVYLAAVQTIEGHAEMFQFIHHFRRRAAHVLDGILVTQIVRPLDGVVHMPVPVVFVDIAQRCRDAALRGDRMRARRKYLGQHRNFKAGLGQRQRGAHPCSARTHHHHIKCSFRQCH